MKSKQDLISLGQTNYLKYAKTASLEDLIDLYAEIREIQTQTEFYFSDSDVRFDVSWVFTYEEGLEIEECAINTYKDEEGLLSIFYDIYKAVEKLILADIHKRINVLKHRY